MRGLGRKKRSTFSFTVAAVLLVSCADAAAPLRPGSPAPSGIERRIGVYEVMIRRLADPDGPHPIYVLTTLCSLEVECPDRLGPVEQRELNARLRDDLGPIVFLDPDTPKPGRYQEIVLGSIRERPDGLRVEGGSICGTLCGSGATYIVVPSDTGYEVTGTDESEGMWVA